MVSKKNGVFLIFIPGSLSLIYNSFLPNGPSTLTNCSWDLLHIDQRPLHVWWHRVIRWCIFHMAFLRYNATHAGIKISIIHTGIQWYLTYLFSNICSQLSSEDAFDTHFQLWRSGRGKVTLLSALLKASDVFFLFSPDGNLSSRSCGEPQPHSSGAKYRMSMLDSTKYCLRPL